MEFPFNVDISHCVPLRFMTTRLKVLHVINSMRVGGAETLVAHSLAPGGLSEFAENTLAYFRGDSHLTGLIDIKVRKICLEYAGWHDLPGMLGRLRKLIMESKFDIIHSHLNPASLYSEMVAPASIPHLHTIHTTYSMNVRSKRILVFLEKRLFLEKACCNVICLSESAKSDFLRSVPFKGSLFVVGNFVADQFFKTPTKKLELRKKNLKMVAIGTLVPLKNFEYLLDVLSYCKNEEIHLDIYGKGDRTRYNDVIRDRGLKARMMGETTDIAGILKNYDLFLMPSKYEGFPLAVFEAMASGLPVMVSNILPLRDILRDNALYFDLDDAEETAKMLIAILRGKVDVDSLAEKGKRHAQNIANRKLYIDRLMAIYERMVSQHA
jgi:glycosyltransferase involved in cell wall biosynthesis